jgi:DNA-binding protein Fis
LDIPTIIAPKQRVPELQLLVEREKLVQFIKDNQTKLSDFLNIFRIPKEALIDHVSTELLSSLNGFSSDHQKELMAIEVADKVWSEHLKPKLIHAVHENIVTQAISYTHEQHVQEVPFEDGRESRQLLTELVANVLTEEKISSHPVQMQLKPTYQIVPEDLQSFLDRVFTETVSDIYAVLHDMEQPLEAALYKNYFNDTVPTKFSLDMLERYHCGKCAMSEIIQWALERPDFWLQELLSNCSRNIDRDPNVSGDEKVTQKAAAYQLLKSIFLNTQEKE